jgi:hypothetical protein
MSGTRQSGRQAADAPTALGDLTAPEEFRRAIVRDPFNNSFRFDFDAARGETPIDPARLLPGGSAVPHSGYYFDLDGPVIDYYRAGDIFPKHSPATDSGGRYFFLTDRRGATTSDLRYMVLRAGWPGDVREIHLR